MSDNTKTHHGGCHCGAVRYQLTTDLTKPVISCVQKFDGKSR